MISTEYTWGDKKYDFGNQLNEIWLIDFFFHKQLLTWLNDKYERVQRFKHKSLRFSRNSNIFNKAKTDEHIQKMITNELRLLLLSVMKTVENSIIIYYRAQAVTRIVWSRVLCINSIPHWTSNQLGNSKLIEEKTGI